MESAYVNTIAVLVIFLLLVYRFLRKRYAYWDEKGVPYLKPSLVFGNMKDTILHNIPVFDHHRTIYQKLAPHPFGGFFNFQRPVLVIRDPELLKLIMTKDFSHFSDRSRNFMRDDNVLSRHLFNLGGESWKNLRAKLTPTFTSGKMKQMFHLMKECSDEMNHMIEEQLDRNVNHLDMKELFAQFTTDVISSCAFGVQANSLRSENADAEFRAVGKKIFQSNFKVRLKSIIFNISPTLFQLLHFSFFSKDVEEFFVRFMADSVKYRTDNKVARNDFLNLLLELKKKDDEEFDDKSGDQGSRMTIELMAAQCFVFFIAGFHTSSNVLTHCLLELSKHPEYQEKLYEEISRALEYTNGEITYDVLLKIPFMEQVICETMRLYPSLSILFRHCVKSYQIPGTNVIIDKGTNVIIPICAIQRDDQYFPNPDVFNPNNFSEENKSNRHPFAFLPFGEGPRICIGLRFGQMQVRLGLATLIRNYQFSLSPKMNLPFKFAPNSFLTSAAGGVWLHCKKR